MRYSLLLVIVAGLLISSCKGGRDSEKIESASSTKVVEVPLFNADSAYHFIERQVAFGPRVPNSKAHAQAADFFVEKLNEYGAKLIIQEFEANTFDGQKLALKNIIASFNPEIKKRILLAAHWDTRPFADKDEIRQHEAIDGANDGASGVGVLLEIARIISAGNAPEVGIDIIFFDGEDWGEKDGEERIRPPQGLDSWWCLGSQYWSKNKHIPNYSAYYGILLDMVGAKHAQFHQEGYSVDFAPRIVERVWNTAARVGFGNYFVKTRQARIIDDHLFVNELARIPMINIVHYDPVHGYFGDYHHTHKDNMSIIDKETLNAVGQTLLHVIYHE
jgi:glutaminyl-peptide cyclotransferase